LLALALDHQQAAAPRLRQVPGDARAHDTAADDDDVRRLNHVVSILPHTNFNEPFRLLKRLIIETF
jgi:hypothetical protein